MPEPVSSSPTGPGCPAGADVTRPEWEIRQWQRAHCVKNMGQLRDVFGDLLPNEFYADLEQRPGRVGHHVDAAAAADAQHHGADRRPGRRRRSRRPGPPVHAAGALATACASGLSHPLRDPRLAARDRDVGGRGPDPPLPDQGAGRDGAHVPAVLRALHPDGPGRQLHAPGRKLQVRARSRPTGRSRCSTTCERTPGVRDVVVSGGDVANVPWPRLEAFVVRLLDIETIRDIRLATKALVGLPQHWLQDESGAGMERVAHARPAARGRPRAAHPCQPRAVGDPARRRGRRGVLDAGVRDVRNQGVLMRGVNDTTAATCSTSASRCTARQASCRTTSTCAT